MRSRVEFIEMLLHPLATVANTQFVEDAPSWRALRWNEGDLDLGLPAFCQQCVFEVVVDLSVVG